VFGLVFTYHIHTHDYYTLQLIPVVALSLGPVGTLIWARLSQIDGRWYRRAAPLGVVLLAGVVTVLGGVAAILQAEVRNPNAGDFGNKVRMYQEIGEIVDHSPSTLFSAPDYGLPLKYHGWLSGVAWPNKYDLQFEQLQGMPEVGVEERFNTLDEAYSPEYFIIVRDFWTFEEQKSLRAFLGKRFPMVAANDDYWVFELREKP
jgi:hypothetical protein